METDTALMIAGAAVGGLALGFLLALLLRPKQATQAPSAPPPPSKPTAEPLRLLALLQREGRMVDFLLEDVQGFSDQQIGSAVREIHRKCAKVLSDHLMLAPVLPQNEGEQAIVPVGFDPSSIRLVGNVAGQPPFTGIVAHRGWRVTQIKLSPPPPGQDEHVIMPAEVELA